jgi:hypothetical protein
LHSVIGTFSLLKALIFTGAVAALASSEPFWHQVVLVGLSAGLSGIGMVIAARIGANRIEGKVDQTREAVKDLKRAHHVDRREADHTDT